MRKFYRKYQKWQQHPVQNLNQRVAGWRGHALQADTRGLLKRLQMDA
ncbi:hypothetical protein JW935_15270 [candidate division KSB1 bacterium]|nr:hypothetical protein [candidate division KSB1 bacterium]